jgi:hypothetical protein
MKNSKEKALELCQKFGWVSITWEQTNFMTLQLQNAKQCALIAVDEAIMVCPFIDEKVRETEEQLNAFDFQFVSYWQQVKTEINNL